MGGRQERFESNPLYPLWLIAGLSVLVNVSLAIFNLLPIPPLDGFGVVESLAAGGRAFRAVIWLRRYGFIILIVTMFTGVLGFIMRPGAGPGPPVAELVMSVLSEARSSSPAFVPRAASTSATTGAR